MENEIYEIPFNIEQLFDDVKSNNGYYFYRIIDYSDELYMDNYQSLSYFVELVGINHENISEDQGTQITVKHPKHKDRIVIDAGGLGDFYSHSFECKMMEVEVKEIFNCANCGLPIEKGETVCSGGCAQEMQERELYNKLIDKGECK